MMLEAIVNNNAELDKFLNEFGQAISIPWFPTVCNFC